MTFQRPYTILFVSLLATLMLAPVAAEYQMPTWPVELLLIASLGVAAVGYNTPQGRRRFFLFVTITAALRVLGKWLRLEAVSSSSVFLSIALSLLATIAALRYALRGRKVDSERLTAALSAYLLAGHCFGIAYFHFHQFRPGSFGINGIPLAAAQFDLQSAIYFSFVTLTTLGYGDIVPLTPTVRGIAVTEAIVGQLYLAVLVARLVSSGQLGAELVEKPEPHAD